MLRWIAVLCVLSLLTLLLSTGVIPTEALGMARALFRIFALLLVISLVFGIAKGV